VHFDQAAMLNMRKHMRTHKSTQTLTHKPTRAHVHGVPVAAAWSSLTRQP